ncbi:hypothetical protein ACH4T9_17905 [Micromonospora sp. NPDC020750]|uniref:hypothetical protein n=1 Tax=unclassified Micromonospora TaxID=2617518 RepID=UPI00324C6DD1
MDDERVRLVERCTLAGLCDDLPALRAYFAAGSEQQRLLLASIETEARARRPVAGLVTRLLGAGATGTSRNLGAGLPGSGPGRADEESFGCPDHACDRVLAAVPAGPAPRCLLTGLPMSRR